MPEAVSPPANDAVAVQELTVVLSGIKVLDRVTLRIPSGQLVALIGPNGSGKTTLLRCLVGLQKPAAGEVRLFGETGFHRVSSRVGYVPQRLVLDRGFILSVREFLSLRRKATRRWFWKSHACVDALLADLLEELDLKPLLDRPVAELSGGQWQRVLIAYSLMNDPDLLLLDEPTAGVDTPGERSFYELISEIHRCRKITVVLVSHDLSMVHHHASRVYALNKVLCCEGAPEEVMNAESLKRAYGIHVTPYQHHHQRHVH